MKWWKTRLQVRREPDFQPDDLEFWASIPPQSLLCCSQTPKNTPASNRQETAGSPFRGQSWPARGGVNFLQIPLVPFRRDSTIAKPPRIPTPASQDQTKIHSPRQLNTQDDCQPASTAEAANPPRAPQLPTVDLGRKATADRIRQTPHKALPSRSANDCLPTEPRNGKKRYAFADRRTTARFLRSQHKAWNSLQSLEAANYPKMEPLPFQAPVAPR